MVPEDKDVLKRPIQLNLVGGVESAHLRFIGGTWTQKGREDIDHLKDRVNQLKATRQTLLDAIQQAKEVVKQYEAISQSLTFDCDMMEGWLRGKVA
ncbi:hypothetical protein J8273_4831 [Carpediemonas membranifera]|uniref:Uncharacterized protein n=1 Tax=Carpediemonas membranifera TaxID=201153 RepID=A0A8J6E3W5_9EUKA|nr:hypothetical protein J8273_4831 [Carpediemonas membranifera]|eukprot:KAG9393712.1 hypothetical protein J8273_4831 [Carpediemonas membranifera]